MKNKKKRKFKRVKNAQFWIKMLFSEIPKVWVESCNYLTLAQWQESKKGYEGLWCCIVTKLRNYTHYTNSCFNAKAQSQEFLITPFPGSGFLFSHIHKSQKFSKRLRTQQNLDLSQNKTKILYRLNGITQRYKVANTIQKHTVQITKVFLAL